MRYVLSLVLVLCFSAACFAQTGAGEYASFLNRTGRFAHDRGFGGAEVIFRTSGVATPDAAYRSWMNSPQHRRLINAGLIHDVQCSGGVCVGRGIGSSTGMVSGGGRGIFRRFRR